MKRCEPKEKVSRPILYLDFETYVQGRKRDSDTLAIEPPLHRDLLPSIVVGDDDPYTPYPSYHGCLTVSSTNTSRP